MTHAHLIVGGTGESRTRITWEKIHILFPTETTLKLPHPDVFELYPEKSIKIHQVKELITFAHKKPYLASYKFILIHDAEKLTLEAANALLKILEEPPRHTHFFLSTEHQTAILPTILSRCEIVETPTFVLTFSEEELLSLIDQTHDLVVGSIKKRLLFTQGIAKDRDLALSWFNTQTQIWRYILLKKYNCIKEISSEKTEKKLTNLASKVKSLQVRKFLDRIESAKAMLRQNTNVQLTVDCLLLAMPRGK